MHYLLLWLLLSIPQTPSTPVPPRLRTTCILENRSYFLSHYNKDTEKLEEHEEDDWFVECRIMKAEKILFKEEVIIPHPTAYRDAMIAVDEWRTKRAGEIIKEQNLK